MTEMPSISPYRHPAVSSLRLPYCGEAPYVPDCPGQGVKMPNQSCRTIPGYRAEVDVVLHSVCGEQRRQLERMIAERYSVAYGACLDHFMPKLYRCAAPDGMPHAAFGLRSAKEGALYLERYLDRPVEEMIAARMAIAPPPRRTIAEIGHMTAFTPGAVRLLLPALAQMLDAQGYRWVVFTATAFLRNSFARLRAPLTELAPADPSRLDEAERMRWGNYFSHHPRVMVGNLAQGTKLLRAMAEEDK